MQTPFFFSENIHYLRNSVPQTDSLLTYKQPNLTDYATKSVSLPCIVGRCKLKGLLARLFSFRLHNILF